MRPTLVWLLILPIRAYRLILSPWLGHSCRFQPSCSVYGIEALQTHGPMRGFWLALGRLARCNPWGWVRIRSGAPCHDPKDCKMIHSRHARGRDPRA